MIKWGIFLQFSKLKSWLKVRILEAQPSSRIARVVEFGHRYSSKDLDGIKIMTLLPLCDATGIEDSCKRLAVALENPRVRNIAVTGPYGSGKSSFLRTYFNEHNVLWVSLAAFLGKEGNNNYQLKEGADVAQYVTYRKYEANKRAAKERQLELAILQQLLYSARASEIPFSRFSRINRIGLWRYFGISLIAIASMLWGVVALAKKADIAAILKSPINRHISGEMLLFLIIGIVLVTILIMWICDIIKKFHLVFKIGTKPVDVEIAQQAGDSAFNKHIDELLYFFSTFKFEAIIFEDIDRFDDQFLFIKLKEINDLINGSRQVWRNKKPIRFIYAVRDDLLSSLDRVKFFDFMLPIVPVMNAQNSRAVFVQVLSDALGVIGLPEMYHRFIRQMSKYVLDRRLLNNICNEFLIYKGRLDQNVPLCDLLGLIMFKNIMPTEFAKLYEDDGVLAHVLSMITDKRNHYYETATQELQSLRKKLDDLKQNANISLSDLNQLYLTEGLLRVLPETLSGRNVSVNIEGHRYQLTTLLFADSIPLIVGKKIEFRENTQYAYDASIFVVTWDQIEEAVGGATYEERKLLLEGKRRSEIDDLEKVVSALESDLPKRKSISIVELIKRHQLTIDDVRGIVGKDGMNSSFVFSLLSGGYLSERYKQLLAAFEEGVITRFDYDFEMAVYNGSALPYDYKLNKVSEVYEDIALPYFATKSILNFDLLRYILSTAAWTSDKADAFLSALFDEAIAYDFIDRFTTQYISHAQVATNIVPFLQRRKQDYFTQLVNVDRVSLKGKYLQIGNAIRRSLRKTTITPLSNSIIGFIEATSDINKMRMDMRMSMDEFSRLVSRCNIKFRTVDFSGKDGDALYDLLMDEKAYEVNHKNVISILSYNKVTIAVMLTKCGTMVFSCKDARVQEWCLHDIHAFINNVYYEIINQQNDDSAFINFMLNHKEMDVDLCRRFLYHQLYGIESIADIHEQAFVIEAIRMAKVRPSWENLSALYLNIISNSPEGFDSKPEGYDMPLLDTYLKNNLQYFSNNVCKEGLAGIPEICAYLAGCMRLSDDAIIKVLRKCRKYFDDLNVDRRMSPKRINALARSKMIVFSKVGYDELTLSKNGANVEYAIAFGDDFVSQYNELNVTTEDLVAIVSEPRFTKDALLSLCSKYEDKILPSQSVVNAIAHRIGVNDYSKFPLSIVCKGFAQLTPAAVQCSVLTGVDFDQENLLKALSLMPGEFPKLAQPGMRPLIPKSKLIESLLEILTKKGIVSSYSEENGNMRVNVKRNFTAN